MKPFSFILTFAILCGLSFTSHAQKWGDQGDGTYANPVLNADFSDPDVIRVGEKYYMVASDFHFMGMQILVSEDMVNWSYLTQIYQRLDFPGWNENEHYAGGSWAPAIRYHENHFYVYFCTPDEGLFMAKASQPEGPWEPLVRLSDIPRWEDPCPLWDEDGQAYLAHSLRGAGPIILHKMSADGTKLLDKGVTIYTGSVAEGPKFLKKDGYYYISLPEGGVSNGWQTILRAKNIYGPYEKKIVLKQGSTNINGPHQGALVETPQHEWWFYHFQETHPLGRVVHLQPVVWQDGWPMIGTDMDKDGIGEPVPVWTKPAINKDIQPYLPATDDDFRGPKLGYQWQFNHNPVEKAYALSAEKGLTLQMMKASSFKTARNTITQKTMGYTGCASVVMTLNEMTNGQRSGLACMGKLNYLLGISKENNTLQLYWEENGEVKRTQTIESPLDKIELQLQIDALNNQFQFAYRTDNHAFQPFGTAFSMRMGFWKGARIGLYGYNTLSNSGKISFQKFRYELDQKKKTAQDILVENIQPTSFPSRTYEVNVPDDSLTARALIQEAIDICSYEGGGTVLVKKGHYFLNGSIRLKSDVNLHLEKGCLLQFSGRPDDFLPVVHTRWEGTELYGHSPMIYAYHASNIAITGKGTIDAQGGKVFASWSKKEAKDRDRLREMGEKLVPVQQRIFGEGTILRPSCIQPFSCSRILIEDITILNSPFWTIHPVYCDNVIVRGVTIDSHYPNNDGCDPESTSNVLIENCTFRTGDDAIAIKSGRDADGRSIGRPSKNIVIRDCLFYSECNGLCIGSEMSGGVENVYMDRIKIGTVKNALYFKSNKDRGGFIRNIYINDIQIECAHGAILRFETNYFGYRGGNYQSPYEDFMIQHVQADKAERYAIFMDGNEDKKIRRITISDFHVKEAPNLYYLMNTEQIRFLNATVNGKEIPTFPPQSPQKKTLDVY